MIYDFIHEIVSTLLVDVADIPTDYQVLIYLFEMWGVFIFMKWALLPVNTMIKWIGLLGKTIFQGTISHSGEWRDGWVRKQRRSLKKEEDD